MSTDTSTTLKLSRVIQADLDTVFQAWTEPDHLKKWSAPEGVSVALAEVDLRVGGRYHIRMRNAEPPRHGPRPDRLSPEAVRRNGNLRALRPQSPDRRRRFAVVGRTCRDQQNPQDAAASRYSIRSLSTSLAFTQPGVGSSPATNRS